MEYSVSQSLKFSVKGSEVAEVVNKFTERWKDNPMDLLMIVKDVYLEGITKGLSLSGHHVSEFKEEDAQQPSPRE